MACGCGKRSEAITTNIAQALIDQAKAQDEQEAMVASAQKAIGNADSNRTAQR
jgi:hypothetical protein